MKTCPVCAGRKVTGRFEMPLCTPRGAPLFYAKTHVQTPVLRIKLRCIGTIRDQPCKTCNGSGHVSAERYLVLTGTIRLK